MRRRQREHGRWRPVPSALLLPLVVVFCVVGVYGLGFSTFDPWLPLGFGVVSYLMRQNGSPAAPLILGLILGGLVETSMRQAPRISHGDRTTFVSGPSSATPLGLTVLALVGPLLARMSRRPTGTSGADVTADGPTDAPDSEERKVEESAGGRDEAAEGR